ncbi:MAG: signal peptidase I, partial [Acidobacteria bacterium]|nr:signal peptidase I [Acidobacteriota bacterium]
MVPANHLKGRALVVYWSFEEEPFEIGDRPGPGGRLRRLAQVAANFFSRTRWDRTFRLVR